MYIFPRMHLNIYLTKNYVRSISRPGFSPAATWAEAYDAVIFNQKLHNKLSPVLEKYMSLWNRQKGPSSSHEVTSQKANQQSAMLDPVLRTKI